MGFAVFVVSLSINGVARQFQQGLSIAEMLVELSLAGKKLAVERNGEIVPRSRFDTERLHDGDRFEIVVAVGGG